MDWPLVRNYDDSNGDVTFDLGKNVKVKLNNVNLQSSELVQKQLGIFSCVPRHLIINQNHFRSWLHIIDP